MIFMSDFDSLNVLPVTGPPPSKVPAFKSLCIRLGIMMIAVFVFRGIAEIIISLAAVHLVNIDVTASYIIQTFISIVFLYILPIITALIVLKQPRNDLCGRIYSKPRYLGRAMGLLPPLYGAAILINIISLLLSAVFADTGFGDSFNTVNNLQPDNPSCAVIMFIQLAVFAPLFEEFWFRGVVMESVRPYGNGFAIFISAMLFGLTHANFQQFFYAFVLGIGFGYIAQSTGSILTTTIMHAVFNSISGIMLVFMSVPSVNNYLSGESAAEKDTAVLAYLVYMFFVIMLMLIGVIMAFWKIRKIRRYKVPKVWTEIGTAKRWGIFFSRVTVIIMLVLAADSFTFNFIPKFIFNLLY